MDNELTNDDLNRGGRNAAARPRPVARWITVTEAGRPRLAMTWSVPTMAAAPAAPAPATPATPAAPATAAGPTIPAATRPAVRTAA